MAAAWYEQPQHRNHHPLKILNRDDNSFMRVKSQTIVTKRRFCVSLTFPRIVQGVLQPGSLLTTKRKSAVELLQETKPLYVKSETVLDRKQELRRSLRGYQLLPNGKEEESANIISCCDSSSNEEGIILFDNKSNKSTSPVSNSNYAGHNNSSPNGASSFPFPVAKSPRLIPPPTAFRKSTNSLQLQNKLRKLLNTDSKENLFETGSVVAAVDSDNNASFITKTDTLDCNSEFSIKTYTATSQQINSNCHKSLPDLSNVRDLSPRSEKFDRISCGFTSCPSACSDGLCKKSTYTDCVSLASCKNDFLYESAPNYCYSQDDTIFEDEPDYENLRGSSLPVSPVKSCTSYITPPPLYCDSKELFRNRPVFRSKSDLGSRNLSSLQPINISLYDSSNLNMFFDNLGLESNEYSSLTAARSNSSSPVFFESSNSSVDSIGGGCASGGDKPPAKHSAGLPSIVERNARIIKWLCNCRKALEQVPRFAIPQSC